MTEETAIERLDYSKPPPGYEAEQDAGDPEVGAWGGAWGTYLRRGGETIWESAWLKERDDSLAAAWTHYKHEHDPPGMRVVGTGDRDQSFDGVRHFFLSHTGQAENAAARAEASAAAWAWHDRRHALAAKLDSDYRLEAPDDCESGASAWPRCLTWTDEQVAEVERWLRDSTAEMPEVLR